MSFEAVPRKPAGLALVDALKAGACCLIVLHHLAFYGPMSDHADDLFPSLFDWLEQHARLAVQVFLVLGGYLSARGLAMDRSQLPTGSGLVSGGQAWRDAFQRIFDRFIRLALPLWAALLLALVCNSVADYWIDHHSISAPPNWLQGALHLLLLQDIAGHEALSAGIWYVAIDFQLFAMLMLLSAATHGGAQAREALVWLVLLGLAVSAFVLNRHTQWDMYGPYFWVSYALGVLIGLQARPSVMALAAAIALLAYLLDPRLRLLVALGTAVVLWLWLKADGRVMPTVAPWCRHLSRISYSVFLVHFPVGLVVNALWVTFLPINPVVQLLGVVTAFKLSLLAGWAFHYRVEGPVVRWAQHLPLGLLRSSQKSF